MAWSKETLTRFLPVLAAGGAQIEVNASEPGQLVQTAIAEVSRSRIKPPRTLGAPDPQYIDRLPAMSGKVTPLFNALRPFIR